MPASSGIADRKSDFSSSFTYVDDSLLPQETGQEQCDLGEGYQ
ncbi:hypothetical protein ES703_59686 [subsurface metagenome]